MVENIISEDVNFMEAEDDAPGLRCPVLHDAIRMVMMSLCYKKFDVSDRGFKVVDELLKRGADPNKRTSNGFDALNMAISDAEQTLENNTVLAFTPNSFYNRRKGAIGSYLSYIDI